MNKAHIKEMNKKDQVDNERKILQLAQQHKLKFIVHLHFSFQTEEMLYLAMDYCPGGDLGELLEVIYALDENEARLWFAEMILAVHSLHQLNCIHRDLKPENFFIDSRGHIKLGDFGLSAAAKRAPPPTFNVGYERERERLTKENFYSRFPHQFQSVKPLKERRRIAGNPIVINQAKGLQAYSVVGSPEFMSPEVLAQREGDALPDTRKNSDGYSFEVDWWSLGCVFYTCILGAPPFSGETPEEVFISILKWEQLLPQVLGQYADQLSKDCYSLLSGFITSPSKRLGKDLSQLKQHKFFEGVNWDQLDLLKSEYVPIGYTSDN
jgi:serine/threonine protein kinase